MFDYIFSENNSGGYTIVTTCLGYTPKNGVENKYVLVKANTVEEAVSKFNSRFSIDASYESSYEGGSCSCCGRRFNIYTNDMNADNVGYIEVYGEEDLSYYDDVYVIE